MNVPANPHARLAELGTKPDSEIDLFEGALLLASIEEPGVQHEPYRRHAEKLADDVRSYAGGTALDRDVDGRLEALHWIIAQQNGYRADETVYDDLAAANMMRVVDRRLGLPVTLGVLYIEIARAQGWTAAGIDFPGRFLVRLDHGSRRLVFDPSEANRALTAADLRRLLKSVSGPKAELMPGHYAVATDRDILLRIQNNIKVRLLRAGELGTALRVVEVMAAIAPDRAELWRETGLLNARLGNLKTAVVALEEYHRRIGGDPRGQRTALLLQELRSRLN